MTEAGQPVLPGMPEPPPKPEPINYVWIEVELGGDFTIDQVWPDGDAPENPTVADVAAVVESSRSLSRFIRDWNLDEFGGVVIHAPGAAAVYVDFSGKYRSASGPNKA